MPCFCENDYWSYYNLAILFSNWKWCFTSDFLCRSGNHWKMKSQNFVCEQFMVKIFALEGFFLIFSLCALVWRIKTIESCPRKWKIDKRSVINDALGQTHSLASNEQCFRLKFVCFEKWERTDGCTTDDYCKNNDHYRPWLWVKNSGEKLLFFNLFCHVASGWLCFPNKNEISWPVWTKSYGWETERTPLKQNFRSKWKDRRSGIHFSGQ